MTLAQLQAAAMIADDAYHVELVRVYGAKNAGDARYMTYHPDPLVAAARTLKRAADAAWHAARNQK